MSEDQLGAALRLAIAALIGLGVGVERQWSGHATGPDARFAGMRTFFMLGLIGGVAGLLLSQGFQIAGAALIAASAGFAIAAFSLAMRRSGAELDATTEVAAIVVTALGALAGLGWIVLSAATGAIVVLALNEKARLHGTVGQLEEVELRAALRFAALALVVLPLLPQQLEIGGVTLHPRALWVIVLFFSALNFAAFVARRFVKPQHGYGVTGALGGFISSTGVTLLFSRRSRAQPEIARPLAGGVIAACTVLVPRVLLVSAVIDAAVAARLIAYLGPVLLVGVLLTALSWRGHDGDATPRPEPRSASPLRLGTAIYMAIAFQVAMMAVDYAQARWSVRGLYATASFLGLTDVDALTVSMSRTPDGLVPALAARSIAVGILANTLFKATMSLTLGAPRFRRFASGGLLLMALAGALMLWLL